MPVFKCNDTLHYFAHVPKCAGQSVEAYLEDRFGTLGFKNNEFYDRPDWQRWSRSSPQHIAAEDFGLLMPADFIASSFAIVRNPYTRLVSAYNFAVLHLGHVPPGQDILEWLEANTRKTPEGFFAADNHLRLQTDIVPSDATVFRMEEGLAPVVAHLDALEGFARGAREIGHENKAKTQDSTLACSRVVVPDAFFSLVSTLYARDFERFGYATDTRPDLFAFRPDGSLRNKREYWRNQLTLSWLEFRQQRRVIRHSKRLARKCT